jgi:UDP-N-acetyl-D-galactosamine dehydrogenase
MKVSSVGVPVVGFDINPKRVAELRAGHDCTRVVEACDVNSQACVTKAIRRRWCNAISVSCRCQRGSMAPAASTFSAILSASRTAGGALQRGENVVYEWTVYPGTVEDDCLPVLKGILKCEI